MLRERWEQLLLGLVLLLLAIAPFVLAGYQLFLVTQIAVYAIAILGLKILMGDGGQISLGHGAYFGIGAFTQAILMTRYQFGFAGALVVTSSIGFLLGLFVGIPVQRLGKQAQALCTLALAVSVPQIFIYFDSWTGGLLGVEVDRSSILPPDREEGMDQAIHLICFTVYAVLFWVYLNFSNSSMGRMFAVIRERPVAAYSLGVAVPIYQAVLFGVSAMLCGLAGGLSALLIGQVSSETFGVPFSIALLVGAVIGGLHSVIGPLLGASFMLLVPNYTEEISKALTSSIYGTVIILTIFLMPKGMAGLLHKILEKTGLQKPRV